MLIRNEVSSVAYLHVRIHINLVNLSFSLVHLFALYSVFCVCHIQPTETVYYKCVFILWVWVLRCAFKNKGKNTHEMSEWVSVAKGNCVYYAHKIKSTIYAICCCLIFLTANIKYNVKQRDSSIVHHQCDALCSTCAVLVKSFCDVTTKL